MNVGSEVVKSVAGFAVGDGVVAEIADFALILSVVTSSASVAGVVCSVAAGGEAASDEQIASDALVVGEEESSAAGGAGDCGCRVVCGGAQGAASDSAVTGQALSALRIPEVSISTDVAGIVAIVASGAVSYEVSAGDAGVAHGEEISQTFAADYNSACVVSGVAGGTVGDYRVAQVAGNSLSESKSTN